MSGCIWHLILRVRLYKSVKLGASTTSVDFGMSDSSAFYAVINGAPVVSFILVFVGFLFMTFTTSLLVFHLYLVVKGLTTNEEVSRARQRRASDGHRCHAHCNRRWCNNK
jgi:hypothetical protein